jgi:ABC-type sugar transport system substrate-binding protein
MAARTIHRRIRGSILLILPVSFFLIFSVGMLIRLAADTRFVPSRSERQSLVRRDAHVTVIFPEQRPNFYSLIRTGLEQYLEDEGADFIGLQYLRPFPFMSSGESMLRQSEIVALAQVDGIIISPPRSEELAEILIDARDRGIAILALNNNLGPDAVDTVVGVDSFQAGRQIGEVAAGLLFEPTRGFFISGADTLIPDPDQFLRGLREGIFASGSGISVFSAPLEARDVFARQRIEEILFQVPEVGLIIADSPEVTLNLAQAVVENNLVGRVTLIGVAGLPEIEEYFDAGIISRLLSINPEEIAIKSLEAMRDLLEGRDVPAQISVALRIAESAGEN